MKKKSFLKLTTVLLFMFIFILSGCGGGGSKTKTEGKTEENTETSVKKEEGSKSDSDVEQVVIHNLAVDPKTLDPQLNNAVDGFIVTSNLFEGLCTTDQNDKAKPGVAEKWEVSEDGLTYTFHLRDSKWSDGKPVVAGDFAYAWKRGVDPKNAAEYAYQMWYIKNAKAITEKADIDGKPATLDDLGVKVIDDKTLEVTLESRTPYFLELCSFPTYYPVREDFVEKDVDAWSRKPESYISNGPFKMKSWKSKDAIVVVKNPEYYDADLVKLDEIRFVMIEENSTAFSAFQAGEIDYTESIPGDQIPLLQKDNDPSFNIFPYVGTYFMVFNTEKAPFDNVNVRKAFTYAINKQAIVETVLKAGQIPATGYVPPKLYLSDGTTELREKAGNYDINVQGDAELAKKFLADAGYPNGEGFPEVEYTYNTNEAHKAIAEAMQQMWKTALGINVKLKNEEWAVFQDTRNQGNFQVARHGWIGDYLDPMTFLDMWASNSGQNDANYKNKDFDAAIEVAKSTEGPERDEALLTADKLLNDDSPIGPLYYYVKTAMVNTKVKNSRQSPLGMVYYKEAYKDK